MTRTMNRVFLALALSSVALLLAPRSSPAADATFKRHVAPLVSQYCVRCHGPDKQEAELKLDGLIAREPPADLGDDAELWSKILERLATGDMPPADEPHPTSAERAAAFSWIHAAVARSPAGEHFSFPDKGNLVPHELLFGSAASSEPYAAPPRLWRISPYQYQSLIASVGGDVYKPARGFAGKNGAIPTPFGLRGSPGLQDYSALYQLDEGQTEQLVINARDLAQRMFSKTWIEVKNRKVPEGKGHDHYSMPRELETMVRQAEELSDEQVDTFLNVVGIRVLRRMPTADERGRYGDFVRHETKRYGNRVGLENALAALLLHPAVLFHIELPEGPTDEHGRTMFSSAQLGLMIAQALTDSAPSNRLLESARSGRLTTRDEVRSAVDAMLADPSRWSENQAKLVRVNRFFQEYFGYVAAPQVFKDDDLLPPEIREFLVNDTDRLVLEILKTDRQVLRQLLTTRDSFVMIDALRFPTFREAKAQGATHPFGKKNHANEAYSLAPEDWREEQPLKFPARERAGILTQPSWLIAHSTNDSNHAIHRGKWIRERLLGGAIPDTPINVDAQLPDEPDKPLRERMRVTREEYCYKCHQRMDPLGLPFEMFDHWGRYRTEEFGKPVDTRGEVIMAGDSARGESAPGESALDGPVSDAVDLVERLANSDYVEQVFVRHAFRYFMGRNETPADAPTLQAAWRAYHDADGSMNALISSLLTSDAFLYRSLPPGFVEDRAAEDRADGAPVYKGRAP
jgi:hypothetical protein